MRVCLKWSVPPSRPQQTPANPTASDRGAGPWKGMVVRQFGPMLRASCPRTCPWSVCSRAPPSHVLGAPCALNSCTEGGTAPPARARMGEGASASPQWPDAGAMSEALLPWECRVSLRSAACGGRWDPPPPSAGGTGAPDRRGWGSSFVPAHKG